MWEPVRFSVLDVTGPGGSRIFTIKDSHVFLPSRVYGHQDSLQRATAQAWIQVTQRERSFMQIHLFNLYYDLQRTRTAATTTDHEMMVRVMREGHAR